MAGQRILILDDDQTQSESLKTAFSRAGHEVFVANRGEDARELIEKNNIQMLFADCLLPGVSGVDFVESIRGKWSAESLQVVLMSGIFTDSAFVKDALRATQAIAFLKKPFEIKEALSLVPELTIAAVEEVVPRKALYQLFSRTKVSLREKRKTIESLDEIHGYDLPFIYSLLVDSKMSGHLNIVADNGDVSGISFSQGVIVAVDIADQETYLGKLLIESGYILPDDLQEALELKSTKKIGEKLIQGNLLSPHAFNIVLSNQMNIRLSRTIVNMPVKINFVETEVETTNPHIDSEALISFLHDWIAGKITLDWLKAHYMQWTEHTVALGPGHDVLSKALSVPLLASLDGFIEMVTSCGNIGQLIDSQKYPEEPFYKALHFLLTRGILILVQPEKLPFAEDKGKLFKKISGQFRGKNKLDVFDLMARMTNVSENDSARVFSEFMKILGDAKVSTGREDQSLRTQLEIIAKEAYDFSKSGNREKLREEMAKAELEQKLKAANQFEEAKNNLQKSQYSLALQLLQTAVAVDSNLPKHKIYSAWAKLGVMETGNAAKLSLKEIEMDLMQVSPEDKFDAIFNFVMGLYHRAEGDLSAAKKHLEKAINMDSTLIVARRELTKLFGQTQPKKDMLNRDLKDLVSGFFKKKS